MSLSVGPSFYCPDICFYFKVKPVKQILREDSYSDIILTMAEKIGGYDWERVAEEGEKSFDRFLELCRKLKEDDPRWTIVISPDVSSKMTLTGEYREVPENSARIYVAAHMDKYPTKGILTITTYESWRFKTAEDMGMQVVDTMSRLLQESSMKVVSNFDGGKEGRNSYSKTCWWLYPSNHPKVLSRARG